MSEVMVEVVVAWLREELGDVYEDSYYVERANDLLANIRAVSV